jgi:hypothetical protein
VAGRDVVNSASAAADKPFTLTTGSTSAYSARVVNVLLRLKNADSKGRPYDVTTSLAGRNTIYGYDTSICSPIPPA